MILTFRYKVKDSGGTALNRSVLALEPVLERKLFKGYPSTSSRKQHGLKYHPHYHRWLNMNDRCYSTNNRDYENYGGRGITVHPDWQRAAGPEAFCAWVDENLEECPEGSSLDRKDNDGNYEPENLRWATRKQQQKNRRPYKKASGLPWGVYRNGKRFRVLVRHGKRLIDFGTYATVEEASNRAQLAKHQRGV